MAKINMLCPFSGALCRECPQYRGRHYYLCFCQKYRGFLGKAEGRAENSQARRGTAEKFELPVLTPSPKWLILNEFVERVKK
jgi:hypothetical protein